MFRSGASRPGNITTLRIASLSLRASCASQVSEHESHPNEEFVALSEGDHLMLVLGWDFGRIRRVMIEGKPGFVRDGIPKGAGRKAGLGSATISGYSEGAI
jgi:hypothetical protein